MALRFFTFNKYQKDALKKGDGPNGSVSEPDKIISFKSE